MTDVFVVRNQLGHYWGKGKIWVDGTDARAVMCAKHRDEAVNTLFELSSKDFGLRGEVQAVAVTERGAPVVEPSDVPLPEEAGSPDAPADGEATAGEAAAGETAAAETADRTATGAAEA